MRSRSPLAEAHRHAAFTPIRLLLACDVRLYRDALATALDQVDGVDVIATAETASEVLRNALALQPTVLVLDVSLGDALAVAHEIRREVPQVRIVAVGLREMGQEIVECVEAGVDGFASRRQSLSETIVVIRSVARGESFCSPGMAAAIVRHVESLESARHGQAPLSRLTARELEVLRLIDSGLSNKQIAHSLSIELSTVKNHVHSLLEKLDAHGRGEAVAVLRKRRVPAARWIGT
jgi:two-component system, NarL family, nitrate/nitrite response regulator NarL